MDRSDVQGWLDRYVEAWRANERGPIEDLFTEDAVYGYRPWDSDRHTLRGREAIVASWLEEPDDPGAWEAHYEPFAVEGDRAVALGWSRYAARGDDPERTYHNAYLLRFAPDGRCAEFHEFYMLEDAERQPE
ncbi:MAG: nuclear transport factor 2 family protein [Candidatus Limnocylindria bacterium]